VFCAYQITFKVLCFDASQKFCLVNFSKVDFVNIIAEGPVCVLNFMYNTKDSKACTRYTFLSTVLCANLQDFF